MCLRRLPSVKVMNDQRIVCHHVRQLIAASHPLVPTSFPVQCKKRAEHPEASQLKSIIYTNHTVVAWAISGSPSMFT